ncbi:MAG: hypothetical protein JWQ98_2746 [Chlorobi bacterium]|nr:hypothetical protein [Chlorobiota bacterium]
MTATVNIRTLHIMAWFCACIAALGLAPSGSQAQTHEWKLVDRMLHDRTTMAIRRYYTFVKPDSLRLRYIRNNERGLAYRLRARSGDNDTLGQLLSITLGQLSLISTPSVRIAVGDDLYRALLLSRANPLAEEREIIDGDAFGHDDWSGDFKVIASIDRIDYRFWPGLAAFASIGAPESNLSWWNDATARIGVAAPGWEFGVIVPFASGGTSFGPWRERLLAPGYGAAGLVRAGPITGRARFTVLGAPAFNSLPVAPGVYVHTLSGAATYATSFETAIGSFREDIGIGYEEFTRGRMDGDMPRSEGYVRRISPIAEVTWTSAQRNLQGHIGVADLSLRGGFTARLTETLWVEARVVSNDILRDPKAFEHPFILFLTPMVKF